MSQPNVYGLPQNLRKDAGGYFLDYRVQEGGRSKRVRHRLGQIPLAHAKRIYAQHLQSMAEHKFLTIDKPKATFNEVADSFLAYSKSRKKSFKNDAQIVGRLKGFFGDRPLESIKRDLVDLFLAQRMQEGNTQLPGKPLSGSTLNHDIATLKSILRRAVLDGQIERNPIERVPKFKEKVRDRTLTDEEYESLLLNCPPHLQAIVKLAYLTGMRRGEIFGLRWDQTDLQNKVITLEATDTKTQEKREVPLSGELKEMFQRIPRTLGSPYVFTYKGRRIGTIKTAWLRALKRAGIKDFKFHDLRHCAVTNLRKAGISDSVIMSISGHKTYSMFKRYNRIDREDRLQAIEQVERLKDTARTRSQNASALS